LLAGVRFAAGSFDPEAVPGQDHRIGWKYMKLVMAIIRPSKIEELKDALGKLNLSGMTITEVRGHGRQRGQAAIYRGKEYNVSLLPKSKIELVLPDDLVDEAIKVIIETTRTGEIGDGRIFVMPVEQGYNIRTGEMDVL